MLEKTDTSARMAAGMARVLRNAGWLAVSKMLQTACGLLLLLYLTRTLGPTLYGAWQFCVAIGSYAVLAGTLGIDTYGVWLVARAPQQARVLAKHLMRLQVLTSGTVLLVLALAVSVIPVHYAISRVLLLFAVSAAVVKALWPDWLLQGLQRGRALAIMELIPTVLNVALVLVIVKGSSDFLRVPASQLVLAVALAPLAWWLALRGTEAATNTTAQVGRPIEIIRASAPLGVHLFMTQVYYNMDFILIGLFRTKAETAYYAAGYKIILVLIALSAAVHSAAYPHLTESLARGRPLTAFVRQLNGLLFLIAVPIAVGGAIVAPQLVILLFGREYAATATSFRLLLWTLPILVVESTYGDIILARGMRSTIARIATIGAALNLALNALVISHYGAPGAALATLMTEGAIICLCVWKAGLGWHLDLGYGVLTVAATALMAISLLIMSSAPVLMRIGLAGLVYAAITVPLLVATGVSWRRPIETN